MMHKTKLRNGSECYELVHEIGRGLHGVVYKARTSSVAGEFVAIKKLSAPATAATRLRTGRIRVDREAEILRKLANADAQHRNIVRFMDEFRTGSEHFLVMEYLAFTLGDFIVAATKSNAVSLAAYFIRMAVDGLVFLHSQHVMHRDLKPSNILLDSQHRLQLKLADFGSARLYFDETIASRVRYTAEVTSRWYRAPELLYGSRNYTRSIDFWSLGCILAELLLSKPLFPGETDIEQLILIGKLFGPLTSAKWSQCVHLPDYGKIEFGHLQETCLRRVLADIEPSLVDLTGQLLSYDPAERFKAQQILDDTVAIKEPDSRQITDSIAAMRYLKMRTNAAR